MFENIFESEGFLPTLPLKSCVSLFEIPQHLKDSVSDQKMYTVSNKIVTSKAQAARLHRLELFTYSTYAQYLQVLKATT